MRRLIRPQAIGIELADGQGGLAERLGALPFVRRVEEDGLAFKVYTQAPEEDAAPLLRWLAQEGVPALQVGVIRPRLQDVFVKLVEGQDV